MFLFFSHVILKQNCQWYVEYKRCQTGPGKSLSLPLLYFLTCRRLRRVRFMKSLPLLVLLHRRRRPTEDREIERGSFEWILLGLLNGRTLDGGTFNWSLSSSSMRIIVTVCYKRHTCVRIFTRGETRHRKRDVNEKWDICSNAAINKIPWMRTGPFNSQ